MDDPKPGSPEWYAQRMAHIAPAGLAWGHRQTGDPRTPEETAECERKESQRRKGRRRKR